MSFSELILYFLFWIFIPPILPGIINRVKALVTARQGPPIFQLYYDLAKLWRKDVVMSTLASPGFILAPVVIFTATLGAALLLPVGQGQPLFSFEGDVILMIYLLALSRFALAWSAMETGSAFEGMGTAREVSFGILAEISMITAILTLVMHWGSLTLPQLLAPLPGPNTALLAIGLFILLLAENCRVPFDDPATHLELTMIHEVMVLDHSGPPWALILHASAIKLMLFAMLLVQVIVPLGQFTPTMSALLMSCGVLVVVISVGLVESLMARLAFRRVPLLLTIGFLFCLFPLLLTWMGTSYG